MSEIKYNIKQGSPEDITSFKIVEEADQQLINSSVIETTFNTETDKVEAHFYSIDGALLQSFQNFNQYVISPGKLNKDNDLIEVTLNPEQDVVRAGFENGDVNVVYNFLGRIVAKEKENLELFIEAVSPDRTEIRAILKEDRLDSISSNDVILDTAAAGLKERIESSEFLEQFVLNFRNNNLVIALNIDSVKVGRFSGVVIKLYQPLPEQFQLKSIFTIEDIISDSILFEVQSEQIVEEVPLPSLRGPNFDIEVFQDDRNPTQFLTLSDLISSESTTKVQALIEQKGIELGIDYTDFENFIFFSSAKERVENFLLKVPGSTDPISQELASSFDHFEKYLYFDEELQDVDEETKDDYLENAELYDNENFNKLTNSIPSFILEDTRNIGYVLFVDMIAQHFDNIWIYSKAVTDRYKADNRLDVGISKDLVKQAVENLGINLYRSNKSVDSLFSVYDGETYNSGSEVISGSVKQFTSSLQPVPKNDYIKEIYKRVYHNIPVLLKSKGTESGIRTLLNCFGIPTNILDIKVYENVPLSFNRPSQSLDFTTSSLDRIRFQDTSSILGDPTLSSDTRIQTYDTIYDENLSTVEIGFSPTDNVNNYIIDSGSVESLDNLIGDPLDYSKNSYNSIQTKASEVLGDIKPYNVQEFVRLIKFFDNTLFRIVQEFIPARTDLVSGIVIKPHLLERSKRKGTTVKWLKFFQTRNPNQVLDFTGSEYGKNFQLEAEIGIQETSAGDAGAFPNTYTTSHDSLTPFSTNHDQAKFNGEFKGSILEVVDGELNSRNKFKSNSQDLVVSDRFETSDYDVLHGNVLDSRKSTFRRETENVTNASVQDSYYSDTGWTNARYDGTTTGGDINLGNYPAIRLTPSKGIILDKGTSNSAVEAIRQNPQGQFNIQDVFFATFSRATASGSVGFRQFDFNRNLVSVERFFLNGSSSLQSFAFFEQEGQLRRIAEKRVFFITQDFIGTTDQNGKVLAISSNISVPLPTVGDTTAVFITDISSTGGPPCNNTTSVSKFITPPTSELSEVSLLGSTVFNDSAATDPFVGDNSTYGISRFNGDSSEFSIIISDSGLISNVFDCTDFFNGGTEGLEEANGDTEGNGEVNGDTEGLGEV